METKDYLEILKEEIHSTVFATVDKEGYPVTRVIDIMLVDEESLYFITAKGKEFYRQLRDTEYVAISGMTGGENSMEKKAISVRGKVRNLGNRLLDKVFQNNPYMAEIYPEEESRQALEVFQLYEGQGEFFDLSTKPITREAFYLGNDNSRKEETKGYYITNMCQRCGKCYSKCPQKCIELSEEAAYIRQENCLHCGNCLEACSFGAVEIR